MMIKGINQNYSEVTQMLELSNKDFKTSYNCIYFVQKVK